jgi:hypothetical protein
MGISNFLGQIRERTRNVRLPLLGNHGRKRSLQRDNIRGRWRYEGLKNSDTAGCAIAWHRLLLTLRMIIFRQARRLQVTLTQKQYIASVQAIKAQQVWLAPDFRKFLRPYRHKAIFLMS